MECPHFSAKVRYESRGQTLQAVALGSPNISPSDLSAIEGDIERLGITQEQRSEIQVYRFQISSSSDGSEELVACEQ